MTKTQHPSLKSTGNVADCKVLVEITNYYLAIALEMYVRFFQPRRKTVLLSYSCHRRIDFCRRSKIVNNDASPTLKNARPIPVQARLVTLCLSDLHSYDLGFAQAEGASVEFPKGDCGDSWIGFLDGLNRPGSRRRSIVIRPFRRIGNFALLALGCFGPGKQNASTSSPLQEDCCLI